MATIVNLAQDYIGSNNINLLMPNGQFGTRDQGGKDHASARYIFTEPSPMARALLHPGDDPLLNYLKDDTTDIEPEWYMPILPLALVNGAEGIGTGTFTYSRSVGSPFLNKNRLEHDYSLLQSDGYRREHPPLDGRRRASAYASMVAWLQGHYQEDGRAQV